MQHAYNPVDWYPWGEEAFTRAKAEDKPIFLSIGYSTCHWCHVMAHESFEDQEVADILNKHFISIKVDREERPDIDSVYMTVCQAMTGHGGWPLTIFMTPEQKPFYAGTYFPKGSRYNLPGLIDVLLSVQQQWSKDKDKIKASGDRILEELSGYFNQSGESSPLSEDMLINCYEQLSHSFDKHYGGFGAAPKFPLPHKLMFLLRYYDLNGESRALEMVEETLKSMYKGGIFDHLAGGFSRYSVDTKWLVPHFEKMLYDNALLTIAYLETYQITKEPLYKKVAEKTIDYVLQVLTSPEGGFYCAEDADSEGEEGKYYIFTPSEIIKLLGKEDGSYFNDYFDITEKGNFEGKNIPNLIKNNSFSEDNERIKALAKKVLEYRSSRHKLHKDDKILTAWNGLMIAALGKAYRILGDDKYLKAAEKAVDFIYKNLMDSEGRLMARYRDRESKHRGFLEDYAFLVYGLIELYEGSYEVELLSRALKLTKDMLELFGDSNSGGLYLYGTDGESLIARPKELYDGALPSGNSVAAYNLIKLARLTGREELEEAAERQLSYIAGSLEGYEMNHSFFMVAAAFALSKGGELVCVLKAEEEQREVRDYLKHKAPFNLAVVVKTEENKELLSKVAPFTEDYQLIQEDSTYYLCTGSSCLPPVKKLEDLDL